MAQHDLTTRVAHRALTPSRVAERFLKTAYDDKFVGKDARLQWSRHEWLLEELPQKGKKKLLRATLQNPSTHGYFDWWIPGNILMLAKLSPSDDFAKIKKKIEDAYEEAHEKTMNGTREKEKELLAKSDWVKKLKWYESQEFYLNVVPEGVDEFTAEAKDFSVKTKWTEFSAYSPSSDFQSHDPYYTQYKSKSPTGARKFYMLLKQDPNALKSISWNAFDDWLTKQKIPHKVHHSQWT